MMSPIWFTEHVIADKDLLSELCEDFNCEGVQTVVA